MADGKVTIDTHLNNDGISKGVNAISGKLGGLAKTLAKASAVIVTAFAAATATITKLSVEAYADYEQTTGGIATLFKASADKVVEYANKAFYTANLSANEYMEGVTSFSASLISALGGDTAKAADIANMAMIDMADNANKMGTDVGLLQNAYQGFAKQNYTMLDNLKLGFGGTKTEMKRLLKTAESITGIKYNINNLADVYSAIHVIQKELGIAGATAEEAEKTITGSANMTKAAWKNVLAAIGGGGDLDRAIDNLVFSITKYFENIVPVVRRSISGIGQLIENLAPSLVQNIASALIQAIPSLINAIYQMIVGLAVGIYEGIVALFTGGSTEGSVADGVERIGDGLHVAAKGAKDLQKTTEEAGKSAKKALAPFDELNRLTQSGGIGGVDIGGDFGVGGGIDFGIFEGITVSDAFGSFIEDIKKKFELFVSWIQEKFKPSFEAWGEAFKSLAPDIKESASRVGKAWEEMRENSLVPMLSYIINDFIPTINNKFSTTFAPIFSEIMPAVIDGWVKDFQNSTKIIDDICKRWIDDFEKIKLVFCDMLDSISKSWEEHGKKILDGSKELRDGLWDVWWFIKENIIDPVTELCGERFTELWTEHLKPLWDNIVDFLLSTGENLLQLWNHFLKPLLDWILSVLTPIINWVITTVVDVLSLALGIIADIVSKVIAILDGVITFVVGVFTGDWERAWEGIVKIFENLFGGLVAIVKGCINIVIGVINKLISAVYAAVGAVVNGVGGIVDFLGFPGLSFPYEPPQIPYLAKGAVLPPNKPFMAMVGDQKHGTNIEAPLSTIQEAVALVMRDQTSAIMAGFETSVAVQKEILEAVLGIQIGDDVIAAAYDRHRLKSAILKGG